MQKGVKFMIDFSVGWTMEIQMSQNIFWIPSKISAQDTINVQGGSKVIFKRFVQLAWPLIIWFAKFDQKYFRRVGSWFKEYQKVVWISVHFLKEGSFLAFFIPSSWLDHIPFGLLFSGTFRGHLSEVSELAEQL